jgi:hypothetical protein
MLTPWPANFMVAEIFLLRPTAGRFLIHVFHRSWASLTENPFRWA